MANRTRLHGKVTALGTLYRDDSFPYQNFIMTLNGRIGKFLFNRLVKRQVLGQAIHQHLHERKFPLM